MRQPITAYYLPQNQKQTLQAGVMLTEEENMKYVDSWAR